MGLYCTSTHTIYIVPAHYIHSVIQCRPITRARLQSPTVRGSRSRRRPGRSRWSTRRTRVRSFTAIAAGWKTRGATRRSTPSRRFPWACRIHSSAETPHDLERENIWGGGHSCGRRSMCEHKSYYLVETCFRNRALENKLYNINESKILLSLPRAVFPFRP